MPQTFDDTRTIKGRDLGKPLTAGVETRQQKWTLQTSFAFKLPSSVFPKIAPIHSGSPGATFLKAPSKFQRFV